MTRRSQVLGSSPHDEKPWKRAFPFTPTAFGEGILGSLCSLEPLTRKGARILASRRLGGVRAGCASKVL